MQFSAAAAAATHHDAIMIIFCQNYLQHAPPNELFWLLCRGCLYSVLVVPCFYLPCCGPPPSPSNTNSARYCACIYMALGAPSVSFVFVCAYHGMSEMLVVVNATLAYFFL